MKLPADITRCVSEDCPHNLTCLRYMDHGTEWSPRADLRDKTSTECRDYVGHQADHGRLAATDDAVHTEEAGR